MNTFYFDENLDRLYTVDEIRSIYEEFKSDGQTFAEYLNNCTDKNGSLTVINTEFDAFDEFIRITVDDEENADEYSIGQEFQLEQVAFEYLSYYYGKSSFDEYVNKNYGIKF